MFDVISRRNIIGLCLFFVILLIVWMVISLTILKEDSEEKAMLIEKEKIIEKDFTKSFNMKDANVVVNDTGAIVEIVGNKYMITAFFDENNNFMSFTLGRSANINAIILILSTLTFVNSLLLLVAGLEKITGIAKIE